MMSIVGSHLVGFPTYKILLNDSLLQKTLHGGPASMARILVVDADPAVASALRMFLEAHDFEVIAAADRDEALEVVAAAEIDVILLDTSLPGTEQSIEAVHSGAPGVPVITMSGSVFRRCPETFLPAPASEAGSIDLKKPFHPAELLRSIACSLDHGGALDERTGRLH